MLQHVYYYKELPIYNMSQNDQFYTIINIISVHIYHAMIEIIKTERRNQKEV